MLLEFICTNHSSEIPSLQLSQIGNSGSIFHRIPQLLQYLFNPSEGFRRDRWNLPRRLWDMMALSVSCQVFTAPLVWFRFHSFPKYFLITNLIALPLTSAVMVLSVTTIALSLLGICPYFLIDLDDRAVGLLVRCLEIISSM